MHKPGVRIKSCQRCRLQKSRCDKQKQHPAPCTRCRVRGLRCAMEGDIDADDEDEEESRDKILHIVTEAQSTRDEESLSPSSPVSMSLDGAVLTLDEARQAFAQFYTSLHPHFPFLEVLDPYACLVESPLLFWTIVTIASKATNRARFERLQPRLRSLAAGVLSTAHQGIPECQALCLLCLWPLDAIDGRGGDNIHLYARVAYAIAVDRGLHRPGFAHEYQQVTDSRPDHQTRYSPAARDATWCAVYFADHQVSSRGGVVGTVRHDEALARMLKTVAVPVAEQCRLVAIRNRFLDAISYHGTSPSGLASPSERLTLLKMLRREVELYLEGLPETALMSQILARYTLVTVGAFCLADDMPPSMDVHLLPLARAAREAAVEIADLLGPLPWETLPMHILRCLVYACIFIAKMDKSRFRLEGDDGSASRAFVERTLSILLPLSFGSDYATRSRTVLKPLLTGTADTPGFGYIACKSRMGANLYWDMFRQEKGMHGWTVDKHQLWTELVNSMLI